jgi:hypothetical protein
MQMGSLKRSLMKKETTSASVKGFVKRPLVEGKAPTKRKRTPTKMNAETSFNNLTVKDEGDAFGLNDT